MAVLTIDMKNSEVSVTGPTLKVAHPTMPTASFPIAHLTRVVIRADAQINASALTALSVAGVALTVLGGRIGERVAHLVGPSHNDARIRIAQIIASCSAERTSALAKHFVSQKIKSQSRLIKLMQGQRPDLRKPFFDAQTTMSKCAESVANAVSLEAIRGFEGAAAAAYFPAYFAAFPESFAVTKRSRRPPADPINAALSLGYTLLQSIAVRASWQAGLDPAIGFLHGLSHGRASLACDLVEPWRSKVDHFVWELFRTRVLTESHFGRDALSGGCIMGKTARSHFYALWQERANFMDRAMLRHARVINKHLQNHLTGQLASQFSDFEAS